MTTLYTPYATSPSTWASTSTATYPPTPRVRVQRQHPQLRQQPRARPVRPDELSDTDDEDDAVEDALFYRRASIDSQRSQRSRTTSIRSFASAYPVFAVLPPNPWPQADPNALPSYSPPDPSSPFTTALYEEDDTLYAPKRRCSSPFARRDSPKPLELVRVESSHQVLISTSPPDDDANEDDDVPTCFQVLRRQWAMLLLRISVGIYRTKRRVARHLPPRVITHSSVSIR